MGFAPLIEIGDNTIIMKGANILPYGVEQLYRHEAPVKIGKNCILHPQSIVNPGEVLPNYSVLWPYRRPASGKTKMITILSTKIFPFIYFEFFELYESVILLFGNKTEFNQIF